MVTLSTGYRKFLGEVNSMKSFRFMAAAIWISAIGCVHSPTPLSPEPDRTQDSLINESHPKKMVPQDRRQDAVSLLLEKTQQALTDDDPARAQRYAERAYRISPSCPRVAMTMARVLFVKAHYIEAEGWAQRALALLPPGNHKSRVEIWQFIAHCRSKLGDSFGADEAFTNALKFRDQSTTRP